MGTVYQFHLPFSRRKFWLLLLVLALLFDSVPGRRGGGGGGFGRGSSGARSSSGSRGSSGGGWFGGLFGGSKSSSSSSGTGAKHTSSGSSASKPHYSGGGSSSGGGYYGSSGGRGSDRDERQKFREPMYTKTGVGSRSRSDTFKNMVVGAAAGYLTYQAGKAIIRSTMGPMMWNNRPYYWGSSYYRPQYPSQPMCRMPMQANDSQFGNVYFQDQTRPKEIVWGCSANEHCCGYECCPGPPMDQGYGGGYYGGSGRSFGQFFSFGSIIVLLLFCLCGGFIIHQVCKARNATGGTSWFSGNKYTAGQQAEAENDPPPQYSTSGPTFVYPNARA